MAAPAVDGTRLSRVLGMPSLILFGLAYMVPLTVFTTYGVVTDLTQGHLPGAYVITLLAMLFTAYSYGRMVTVSPYAGSAYTYSSHAFGANVGFMTGWALLLDYLFLPMINYLVIGIYMAEAVPAVPAWAWVSGSILVVTVLNVLGIKMVARMNFLLVAVQVVFIAVFAVLVFRAVGGAEVPGLLEPFYGSGTDLRLLLAGAAILCLSFLGFDAVSTLSEETHDPKRRIPRAIMLVTLLGGVTFIVVSYLGHLVFPRWQEFTDVDSAALDVMEVTGGSFMAAFFTAAYVAGCFGSAMASQASVSRILFAMGRDGVLPRGFFGRLSARFHTPVRSTLLVGAVSCVALFISLELAAAVISFGALAAFSFVNLAVIKAFVVDRGRRTPADLVRYGVVPGIGVLLTGWLWTSLSGQTFAFGLGWVAIGLVYLAGLTRMFRRPAPQLDLREQVDEEQPANVEVRS
jgi:putrescine importer